MIIGSYRYLLLMRETRRSIWSMSIRWNQKWKKENNIETLICKHFISIMYSLNTVIICAVELFNIWVNHHYLMISRCFYCFSDFSNLTKLYFLYYFHSVDRNRLEIEDTRVYSRFIDDLNLCCLATTANASTHHVRSTIEWQNNRNGTISRLFTIAKFDNIDRNN